jgi:hypothetical protein
VKEMNIDPRETAEEFLRVASSALVDRRPVDSVIAIGNILRKGLQEHVGKDRFQYFLTLTIGLALSRGYWYEDLSALLDAIADEELKNGLLYRQWSAKAEEMETRALRLSIQMRETKETFGLGADISEMFRAYEREKEYAKDCREKAAKYR